MKCFTINTPFIKKLLFNIFAYLFLSAPMKERSSILGRAIQMSITNTSSLAPKSLSCHHPTNAAQLPSDMMNDMHSGGHPVITSPPLV